MGQNAYLNGCGEETPPCPFVSPEHCALNRKDSLQQLVLSTF